MTWPNNLRRILSYLVVPRLSLILVVLWAVTYLMIKTRPGFIERLMLDPAAVLHGEVWRVVTFILIPPVIDSVFILLIYLLFFNFIGTLMEHTWGAARYNGYIWTVIGTTVAAAFLAMVLSPSAVDSGPLLGAFSSNGWGLLALPLAVGWHHGDLVVHLFFVLPVKMKWIAVLDVALILFTAISFADSAPWLTPLALAPLITFLLWHGTVLLRRVRRRGKRMVVERPQILRSDQSFHRCATCEVTEHDDPNRRFRVCTTCQPAREYCDRHIKDHDHVQDE